MNKFKHHVSIFFLLLTLTCTKSHAAQNSVLVSLAPYKFIVERIAGNTLDVNLMVPSGGSPHTFEPSIKQILQASKADVWFQISEPFEKRATEAMTSYQTTKMRVIDLREGLDLIKEVHSHCPHHGCTDPHVWLSPKLVKRQAEMITKNLIDLYPEHQKIYLQNLHKLQRDLDNLDKQIINILHAMKKRTIFVSHPAYAYFCRDYNLRQISFEFEGKEPSPQQLTKILAIAKKAKPPFVFVQAQHKSKGAKLIAKEIGAEVIEIDPLSENYIQNLLNITKKFAAQ